MPTKTINNLEMHYLEAGRGTPLVLIHGFPLDARMWEAQLSGLDGRFRVIAPDLRGFGRSAQAGPFTMRSLAGDVHDLLAGIGALPCVLGGLSMGGYVAMAYATRFPRDLRGLMLIDTKHEADTAEGKENRRKMVELARTGGAQAVAEQMMPRMVAAATRQNNPACVSRLRQIMESCPISTIEHAQLAMCDRDDYRGRLASIAVPTLIVVGDQDAFSPPAVARAMHAEMPGSTLRIIADAGHMAPMEQPGSVNDAIGEFAAGC